MRTMGSYIYSGVYERLQRLAKRHNLQLHFHECGGTLEEVEVRDGRFHNLMFYANSCTDALKRIRRIYPRY